MRAEGVKHEIGSRSSPFWEQFVIYREEAKATKFVLQHLFYPAKIGTKVRLFMQEAVIFVIGLATESVLYPSRSQIAPLCRYRKRNL